ncbi:hypothetical protein CCP2SC5_290005 [Azospirillaceae bacterium]
MSDTSFVIEHPQKAMIKQMYPRIIFKADLKKTLMLPLNKLLNVTYFSFPRRQAIIRATPSEIPTFGVHPVACVKAEISACKHMT